MPHHFVDLQSRPGWIRIRGQESRTSLNKVSILARKLTSIYAVITTKLEFHPKVHQHSAGLILYYDNMNYINLRKYYSETLGQGAISVIHLENGTKTEFLDARIAVKDEALVFQLTINGREAFFQWGYSEDSLNTIGQVFDVSKFSDEYSEYGEFTGTMVGITCADRIKHEEYADFDYFSYMASSDIL